MGIAAGDARFPTVHGACLTAFTHVCALYLHRRLHACLCARLDTCDACLCTVCTHSSLHTSLNMSVRMSVRVSVRMSERMSVCMVVRMSARMSVRMCVRMSVYMSLHMPQRHSCCSFGLLERLAHICQCHPYPTDPLTSGLIHIALAAHLPPCRVRDSCAIDVAYHVATRTVGGYVCDPRAGKKTIRCMPTASAEG